MAAKYSLSCHVLKGHGFSRAASLLICHPSPAQRAGDLLFLATGNLLLATFLPCHSSRANRGEVQPAGNLFF